VNKVWKLNVRILLTARNFLMHTLPVLQAVYSYPKYKLGLYHLIKTEEEVNSIVRAAGALPLLPTGEILCGLFDLGQEAVDKGWMPQLRLFFKYLEKEWVRKIPVLSVWKSKHRTNNIAESTNRSFNKQVKVSSPSVFTVLSKPCNCPWPSLYLCCYIIFTHYSLLNLQVRLWSSMRSTPLI